MYEFVLFGIVLSCFGAYLHMQRRKSRTAVSPPLYPGAWPILGHLPLIFSDSKAIMKTQEAVLKYGQKTGQYTFTFKLANRTVYATSDPEDCMTVANTCLDKDELMYKFLHPWLGDGLLIANADVWKRHRKILNKALNQQILDGFLGVFNNQAKFLAEKLESNIGIGPFDHFNIINTISLDTLYSTIMGVEDTKYSDNLKEEYFQAIHGMYDMFITRLLKCWLYYEFIFKWTHLKKVMDRNLQTILKLPKMITEKKVLEMEQNVQHSNSGQPERKNFMDLVLRLWKMEGEFTEKQAMDHVNTMMVAGHDTVSTATGTILLVLGSYPDVQDKIYQELQEIVGGSDSNIEKMHLGQLKYMEAVIKEVLRLYPSATVIGRKVVQDVQLKKYTLKAGTNVMLSIHGLNRHPVWGPDVNQFKPERWLDRKTLPENLNAFSSFSIGRRNCIGINYAMMTMKIFLAHIVRRCRITADITKTKFKLDIVIKPFDGHYITLEKR